MRIHRVTRKPYIRVHLMTVFIIIISTFILLSLIRFLFLQHSYNSSSTKTPKTSTIPSIQPFSNVFTSPDLGISFHYRTTTSGAGDEQLNPLHVTAVANKIYLYQGNFQPIQDKYVQVITKAPTQTMSDAIQYAFLQGYSPKCHIVITAQQKPFTASTYTRATVAPSSITTMSSLSQCPRYLENGVEYFLMDASHPNKLLFFHIGQDNYGSGVYYGQNSRYELTWDETISFLH